MSSRAVRVGLAAIAGLVTLLVLSQLVLPRLAARSLRHRLERNGAVEEVKVSAFPAVKLLWGQADRISLRVGDGRAGPGRFAELVLEMADAERVDARVTTLRILALRFRDVTLRKRGRNLSASADVTNADLRAALPPGFEVRPVASRNGVLVFEGRAKLLGRELRAQATVSVREGGIVLAPELPLGGLLTLTIFQEPRIEVSSVSTRPRPDGFSITARARLRG